MRGWLVALCCGAIAPVVTAEENVAAVNMNPDWEGINGWAWYIGTSREEGTSTSVGQEFVAGVSGKLTTLEASVDKFAGGAPLVITFHTAVDNVPGAVLGSVSIPAEQVGSWAGDIPTPINTFDVSEADVSVEEGQNYFVVFSTPLGGEVRYRAILTAPNENSFGYRAIYSLDGTNWVFPTITPEVGIRLYVESQEPPPPVEYEVAIDVLADTPKTAIKLGAKNPKPLEVHLFGNGEVSAVDVIVESLGLGDPTIAGGVATVPFNHVVSDINGDGIPDLALWFDLIEMQTNGSIDSDTTVLELRGLLTSGDLVIGYDFVELPAPKGNGKGNNGRNK
jgi:hypothetical protein